MRIRVPNRLDFSAGCWIGAAIALLLIALDPRISYLLGGR